MKRRRLLHVALGVALALGASLARREAPAQPAGAGEPSPATPPSAPPPFESFAAGLGSSAVPTADEWRDLASDVKLSRRSARAGACSARRVREWLRIRCTSKTFAISLLGGSKEGLAFWIGPDSDGQFGEVQFPLRRGDRRVIQLWRSATDAKGIATVEPAFVVQEHWTSGEPAPTVTVL